MNRQEIEKRFDRKFSYLDENTRTTTNTFRLWKEIKSFFFDEILPEVLGSVLTYNWSIQWDEYDSWSINEQIEKIAKEKYNINL